MHIKGQRDIIIIHNITNTENTVMRKSGERGLSLDFTEMYGSGNTNL